MVIDKDKTPTDGKENFTWEIVRIYHYVPSLNSPKDFLGWQEKAWWFPLQSCNYKCFLKISMFRGESTYMCEFHLFCFLIAFDPQQNVNKNLVTLGPVESVLKHSAPHRTPQHCAAPIWFCRPGGGGWPDPPQMCQGQEGRAGEWVSRGCSDPVLRLPWVCPWHPGVSHLACLSPITPALYLVLCTCSSPYAIPEPPA